MSFLRPKIPLITKPKYHWSIQHLYWMSHQLNKLAKKLIYLSVKGHCAYCGSNKNKLTLDHIDPLCRSKDDSIANILPACSSCNHLKNNLSVKSFRKRTVGDSGLFYYEDGQEKDIPNLLRRKLGIKDANGWNPTNADLRMRLIQLGILKEGSG